MHELSIAQALVTQIEEIVRREGAQAVISVTVEIGSLSGVDPDALELAFPCAARDTVAEGARLEWKPIGAISRCHACAREFRPDFPLFFCGHCGSDDVDVRGGRELRLTSLELDIPRPIVDTPGKRG